MLKNKTSLRDHKLALIVCLVFIVAPILVFLSYSHIPSGYIKTEATEISQTHIVKSGGGNDVLSFVANNGETITYHYFNLFDTTMVNSKVTVYYNPSNPNEVKVKTTIADLIVVVVASILIPTGITYRVINRGAKKKG